MGTLTRELEELLAAMRTAATARVTLQGGPQAWHTVTGFLAVGYADDAPGDRFALESSIQSWLPECTSIPEKPSPKTGTEAFDPRNAIDEERKTFAAQGTTRKPGAHRDNTGHR